MLNWANDEEMLARSERRNDGLEKPRMVKQLREEYSTVKHTRCLEVLRFSCMSARSRVFELVQPRMRSAVRVLNRTCCKTVSKSPSKSFSFE